MNTQSKERPKQSPAIREFEAKRNTIMRELGSIWATSPQITSFLSGFAEGEIEQSLREGSVPAIKIGGLRAFSLLPTGAPRHAAVCTFEPTSSVTILASALKPTSEGENH
jgi:hypothetical protein